MEIPHVIPYRLVLGDDITAQEITDLRLASSLVEDVTLESWRHCLEESMAVYGARSVHDQLVGVAFLIGNRRHAQLVDILVQPEFRRKGIGSALVIACVERANLFDIPHLYANVGSAEQHLFSTFTQLGFIANNGALVRKHR